MRARWYDPDLGRFLSEDPVGIQGGLNQYVFAGNDPINGVDPNGTCAYGNADDPSYASPGAVVTGSGGKSWVCNCQSLWQPGDHVNCQQASAVIDCWLEPLGPGCESSSTFSTAWQTFMSNNLGRTPQVIVAESPHVPVHGIWHYGNYCGAGGMGTPVNGIDSACMDHDACFSGAGATWQNMQSDAAFGTLLKPQRDHVRGCNQQLCNAMTTISPNISRWNISQRSAAFEIRAYFRQLVPAGATCR
jgi:hypothetical protein